MSVKYRKLFAVYAVQGDSSSSTSFLTLGPCLEVSLLWPVVDTPHTISWGIHLGFFPGTFWSPEVP